MGVLNPKQIENLLLFADRGFSENRNISITPYTLHTLAQFYKDKTQKASEDAELRAKLKKAREETTDLTKLFTRREETIVKLTGDIKKLKSENDRLKQRIQYQLPYGHWTIYGPQAQCSACGGIAIVDGLDTELPYNFCPNCGTRMFRKKIPTVTKGKSE